MCSAVLAEYVNFNAYFKVLTKMSVLNQIIYFSIICYHLLLYSGLYFTVKTSMNGKYDDCGSSRSVRKQTVPAMPSYKLYGRSGVLAPSKKVSDVKNSVNLAAL